MINAPGNAPQKYGHLIVVVGLPGSGKTTYMQSLQVSNPAYVLFDDYQGKAYNSDPDPRLSEHFGHLVSVLKQGQTAVVSDVRYCDSGERNAFLGAILNAAPNVALSFTYFQNNPDLCKANIQARGREDRVRDELVLVDELTRLYAVPSIEVLPVYTGQGS